MLSVDPHPLLELAVFETVLERELGACANSGEVERLLDPSASASFASDDDVRKAVRDLLRHGGYKPTGRGKPASEYLLGAAAQAPLARINPVVDACNAVSLHSGLPISVIDVDLARLPCSIAIAPAGASYVFNTAGHAIDLEGLVCLFDADGPCANAVKDAQRTKTHAETRRTWSLVWGTRALLGRAHDVAAWYRTLLAPHATREIALSIRSG